MTAFKSENLPQRVRDIIAKQGHKDNVAKIAKRVNRTDKAELEGAVQKACMEFLEVSGYFGWRQNRGIADFGGRKVSFGVDGMADWIGMMKNGRFLAVEFKRRDGGVQSKKQKDFQADVEASHGVYILAASVDDLQAGLQEAGA